MPVLLEKFKFPNDERIRLHNYGKVNQNEHEDRFEDMRKGFLKIIYILIHSSDEIARMFGEAVVQTIRGAQTTIS
jgi:hypothetical protein